ncbi:MAG: hypothetical protein UY35_C0007G0005 [Candidatus Saccharibacteria bacterium GW2011_GWC2_48_9]|nr:MAG: hypothetical protein UY35_C0007G0005 [Candidatus Saccharibacteria bacterium GW2011_GWC2_48_9]HCH34659.1 hypothetical protein [Candidatus Saccharibacteria bacterium]
MGKINLSLSELTASRLRLLLLGGVVVVLALQIGLIVLGQKAITGYAQTVSSSVSTATSDQKTLSDLQLVNNLLKQQSETVEKSGKLIADGANTYAYQNQIINDITNYANQTGIQVTGFTFTDSAAAGTSTAPAPAATATTGTAPAATTSATPAGLSPVTVSVSLVPGMSYSAFYKFLQLIEGNLLQMQIGSLNLTPSSDGSTNESGPNAVGLSNITIQVFTKK